MHKAQIEQENRSTWVKIKCVLDDSCMCSGSAYTISLPVLQPNKMLKDPIVCPFCRGNLLQGLEPSELGIDESIWTIFHWQCIECGETFDKMVEEAYSDVFYEDEGTDSPTDS